MSVLATVICNYHYFLILLSGCALLALIDSGHALL